MFFCSWLTRTMMALSGQCRFPAWHLWFSSRLSTYTWNEDVFRLLLKLKTLVLYLTCIAAYLSWHLQLHIVTRVKQSQTSEIVYSSCAWLWPCWIFDVTFSFYIVILQSCSRTARNLSFEGSVKEQRKEKLRFGWQVIVQDDTRTNKPSLLLFLISMSHDSWVSIKSKTSETNGKHILRNTRECECIRVGLLIRSAHNRAFYKCTRKHVNKRLTRWHEAADKTKRKAA